LIAAAQNPLPSADIACVKDWIAGLSGGDGDGVGDACRRSEQPDHPDAIEAVPHCQEQTAMIAAGIARLPRLVRASFLLGCAYLVSSAPVIAQTPNLSRIGSINGPADLVQVDGKVLYVVADRTLRIIDVTNPSVPQAAGAFTFPEHIRSFAVSGSHVYVLADFHGIRILDVSSPASPVLRGSLELKGGYFTIVLYDKNVLLASSILSGLQIIDVSDVAKPALLTSYFTDGYAQSISVSRPLAYVMDDPTGLYVFDLSNPRSPAVVTLLKLNVPRQQGSGAITTASVAVSEAVAERSPKVAVLLDSSNGLLQFYDVSSPAAPVSSAARRSAATANAREGSRPPNRARSGSLMDAAGGRAPASYWRLPAS